MEPELRQKERTYEDLPASRLDAWRARRGLSSSGLKMIAVITMLIDHIAAVLLVKVLINNGTWKLIDYQGNRVLSILTMENMDMINLYQIMRNIGRIAFPIYCFLLVEGFARTHDIRKYLGRMFLFALLSEVPFDLALAGKAMHWDYQNVMFTLFWGLAAMYISHMLELKTDKWFIKWPLTVLIWGVSMLAAELMMTDYGAKGVLCIGVLYLLRYVKGLQILGGALSFTWEMPAPVSFIFIALYNGKKGMSMKHFFYAFYPVHLLILYVISAAFGMGNIAAI